MIQADWFPESEYGAVYGLLGDDYEVDVDNKIVSGSLVSQGQPTGVNVEIRAGGPAIGSDVETELYTNDEITFAFGTTDGQILSWENTPMLSVVAPLDINPQIIMWDPETYPDVETIADLGEAGVTINVFGGQTFTDVLVGQGILHEDQIDPSYDGGPTRFIGENGAIAQQGFASSEPFQYEFVYEDWMKPVAYQTIHDAGFQVYSQTLAIRPEDLETLRPCLELFVPVVQQSAVDFVDRSGPHERGHRRHRRAVRHVLDVHARARRLLGADPARARPHRQRPRRHARQHGRGADRDGAAAGPRRRPRGARRPRSRPTCSPTSSSTSRSGSTRKEPRRPGRPSDRHREPVAPTHHRSCRDRRAGLLDRVSDVGSGTRLWRRRPAFCASRMTPVSCRWTSRSRGPTS